MDFLMNLIQLGLDAGILALCCEVVFRQKAEIKAKDFFVFPIFLESFRMVPPRFWRGRIDSLYHITLFYHFFHKRKRNFF